jgi:peroxiredoxin
MTITNIITPGQLAPDFELKDINENSVRLSSFRGNKPVVLAFLRGFM